MARQNESATEKNRSRPAEMTTDNPVIPRAAGQASDSHQEEVTRPVAPAGTSGWYRIDPDMVCATH